MEKLDSRLTPARADLAADHLRGRVMAETFVAGRPMRIAAGLTPVHRAPHPGSSIETHALHGENVMLYEDNEGWGWVQLQDDSYVGYLSMASLRDGHIAPTHRVCVNRTFIYPGPDMKLPPLDALPLGARVVAGEQHGAFMKLETSGFVFAAHLSPCTLYEKDFVAVAERLLHVPYLWGGKSCLGIDCSGLVQLSLAQTGLVTPRDTDLQEQNLGRTIDPDNPSAPLQRGDLVFWKGHVGIMRNETELLHANGHHMQVVSEPLAEARARILEKSYGPITAVKRLS